MQIYDLSLLTLVLAAFAYLVRAYNQAFNQVMFFRRTPKLTRKFLIYAKECELTANFVSYDAAKNVYKLQEKLAMFKMAAEYHDFVSGVIVPNIYDGLTPHERNKVITLRKKAIVDLETAINRWWSFNLSGKAHVTNNNKGAVRW